MSIPTSDPLMARLLSLAGPHKLYACIDLASAPGAFARAVKPAGPRALCLFDGALTDNARHASPWLLPVHPGDDPYGLWKTCDIAQQTPAVTWFASPLTCADLRARLARRLDIQFGDGTQWLLRFFDPRILDELHAHLEPANAEAFFALGGRWCWLDRDGELQHRDLGESADPDPMRPPLRPTASEERALTLATEAGHLLTQASKRWPDGFTKLSGRSCIAMAKRTCAAADDLNLATPNHRVQLLMLAAAHGADYFDSEAWSSCANRIRTGTVDVPTLLAEALQARR